MKCSKVTPVLVLMLATIGSASSVLAQESVGSAPLTDSSIKGFCAVLTDAVEWAEDNNERLAGDDWEANSLEGEQMQEYLTSLSAMYGRNGDAATEFENMVRRHGFASTNQWEETADRITQAWVAIMVDENKDLSSSLTDGISEALLGSLTDEQRKQMKTAIDAAQAELEAYQSNVSPEDVAVVSRNRALLEEFFGSLSTKK
jgi:hypothetical protein